MEKVVLDGVMETLLIPLFIRAKDAKSDKPFVNDKKALEILEKIDYDFEKFDTAIGSYFGTLSRVSAMDKEVEKFIKKHPYAKIVSIGCGFDSRFERIDNGKIEWYNLDFPEVIELRKRLFDEHERVINIASSALNPAWTKEVKKDNRPLLIVSEGVLMYLSEEEVKTLLTILTTSFKDFEAHFDLLYKRLVNKGGKHDTVKHTKAEFRFGVTNGQELVELNPRLRQIGLINFTTEMRKQKLGLFRLLVPFFYIVHDRLGKYTYHRE